MGALSKKGYNALNSFVKPLKILRFGLQLHLGCFKIHFHGVQRQNYKNQICMD